VTDFWAGLICALFAATICALILHWAGVL